jgi:LmbE family N-acetylglucosaminyl deacetylase
MSAPLPRRVLALGAHPDDIELSCAGTLAKFLEAGSEVHLAVACRGDRGGSSGPDPDLANCRHLEARHAAEALGAPIHFLDIGDTDVWDTPELRRRFISLFRVTRPELILTHCSNDYHDDHVRVSDLACKCAWFAASPGHLTDEPPLDAPPGVFFMDNLAGIGFEPTHLVDISATFETKRRMLACHESQLRRADGGMSKLVEMSETLARLRGFQCGASFAEGFRPALLWGRRRAEPVFP